jgi:hypothetical protein
MADPICRWRNPYIDTVIELINILPKEELLKHQAREIVNHTSPYEFYRTPYQLACQLGLYHETNGRYFPKFTFIPNKEQVKNYLTNWIIHYCIPNPYTMGFQNVEPFSIHAELCSKLFNKKEPIKWNEVKLELFGPELGNEDILINAINTYSPIITIQKKNQVLLKAGQIYDQLEEYIQVDINQNRNNKEYFFDLFSIQNNQLLTIESNEITGVTDDEIKLINDIQHVTNLTQTEKNQLIVSRIGQGIFRRDLILDCGYCPITLVDDTKLLIASHIKPWRLSDNNERLNPKNGFLLTPTYDGLFDKGFISFTNDKRIIISPKISNENKNRLNLIDGTIYPRLPILGREDFLDFHRTEIFIK